MIITFEFSFWITLATIVFVVATLLGLTAYLVLVERKVASPLVDLGMFTHRQVAYTNVAGLLIGFASFAQFIGISYLVQMLGELEAQQQEQQAEPQSQREPVVIREAPLPEKNRFPRVEYSYQDQRDSPGRGNPR